MGASTVAMGASTASQLPPVASQLPPVALQLPPVASQLPPAASQRPPAASHLPPVNAESPKVVFKAEASAVEPAKAKARAASAGADAAAAADKDSITLSTAVLELVQRCRAAKLWAFIVGPLFPETCVGIFADGTIAYTLSKTWHDLITIWVFGLNVEPFCKPDESHTCAGAGSGSKFVYAFAMLIPAAFVKRLASTPALHWVPSIETVPGMVGMLAGWGLGDAFVQLFAELRTGRLGDWLCGPPPYEGAAPSCTELDVSLALLLTVVASLVIHNVKPLTSGIQWGDGALTDYMEDWFESIWQLHSKVLPPPSFVFHPLPSPSISFPPLPFPFLHRRSPRR